MLYRPCHQRNVSCSPNSSIDTLPCSSLSFRNSKGVIQQAHFWHLIQPFSTSTLGNSSRRSQCNGNSFLTVFVHFCMVQQGEVGVFPLFHGLYGVLYIQSQNPWMMVDDGEHWVMWELDDAMFLESGYVIYQILCIRLVIDIQLVVWFHVWCHSHPYKCFWILAFTWSITASKIKTSTDISLFKWLLWIACPSQPSTPFSHPFDLSDKKGVKFPDWTKLWLKQT